MPHSILCGAGMTPKEIEELQASALEELSRIADLKEIEGWRIRHLGKNAKIIHILRGLGELPPDQRRSTGAVANQVRQSMESALTERQKAVKEADAIRAQTRDKLDITLPGRPIPLGRLHPTTQILREICGIFASMGFQVAEGPEVERDYYNFEALNIPEGHPARDMWATFWMDSQDQTGRPMLLRTHTSPMQIRIMEKTQPPIRVIVPGKVYRYEATDATHEAMFYQVEGLAVDKGITMADLKGTLFEYARQLFGRERKARFRCDYFPFVEPGVEMAIDCMMCKGKGCRICSHTGWLEILGAGMVHPDVLRRVGYDPDVYSGFAFGMGVERMVMLRYGIEDIRLFYSNDLRFLKQF
jgi:phenylalanyl-tRNA synthetase alpha chain